MNLRKWNETIRTGQINTLEVEGGERGGGVVVGGRWRISSPGDEAPPLPPKMILCQDASNNKKEANG